jgi:RNA polymerase sigma-70 factor (ECF subfamily)
MAGAETDEICKELNISMSNAWIILYRPRIRLRERLDLNRFGNKRPAKA